MEEKTTPFTASLSSAGLAANFATARNNQKRQTTTAPETDRERRKSEHAKEERETPGTAAREKSEAGNSPFNSTAKRET
ncbi:MAG: hypothetical protein EPO57_09320 [Chitinophagaceae bacterium]|nr:MAG: hypothetical protein EPO57_09320 [Chitinophagaceae bacterium]